MNLALSHFDFPYPDELVAQHPLPARDASRMMVVDRRARSRQHARVAELGQHLRAGDLLIVNDSRVVPARLFGRRADGSELEILVLEPVEQGSRTTSLWRCLARHAKRIRPGEPIRVGEVEAVAIGRDGPHLLIECTPGELERAMARDGVPPLPPYIRREGRAAYTDEDRERYQTVYAREPGSAAAPTAGLHLSLPLLAGLRARGIALAPVTLHVGIDTFTPVRTDDVTRHRMHGERVVVPASTAMAVARAKAEGRRVVAVGTTAVRALESACACPHAEGSPHRWPEGSIRAGAWTTDLFIRKGYGFRAVDAILTNFHQPRSTLIMMVSAFAGRKFLLDCYQEAVRERYRLFSYGDCMLIV